MSIQSVAGTNISISAVLPATYDAVGYAALTYSKIGEITDGGSHGRVYAEITHQAIDRRDTQKLKGSFNEGTKTLQLAIDPADAGQAVLKAALDSDNAYAFRVEYQDGAIDYFPALVLSFEKAAAGTDSVLNATVNLSLTTSKTGVGIVEVGPPPSSFTLTYTAGANGSLLGTSPQTVARNATGTPVAAVPASGYEFVQWSDGSTANPRADSNVVANVTVTAAFQPE